MIFVQLADPTEKQTVFCHCVIRARPGENQSVVAAKGGNHDRDRHDRCASAGENHIGRFRCDTIAWRTLNCRKWKRREVCDIRQQIESDHEKCSERERKRNVAARILHFASGERDIVPGVGGKKRIGLRHANADEQTESCRGGKSRANFL